jgi:hypothetical protein
MSEDKDYIALNGDPIRTTGIRAVLSSPALHVPMLATIFMSAASYQDSPAKAATVAALGLIGTATGHAIPRFFINKRISDIFKEKADVLCINKKPEAGKTPPTSPDNLSKASKAKSYGVVMGLTMGAGFMILKRHEIAQVARDLITLSSTSFPETILPISLWVSTISAYLNEARNFHQVIKGDWVITELPKPQEKEEKALTILPQPTQG